MNKFVKLKAVGQNDYFLSFRIINENLTLSLTVERENKILSDIKSFTLITEEFDNIVNRLISAHNFLNKNDFGEVGVTDFIEIEENIILRIDIFKVLDGNECKSWINFQIDFFGSEEENVEIGVYLDDFLKQYNT